MSRVVEVWVSEVRAGDRVARHEKDQPKQVTRAIHTNMRSILIFGSVVHKLMLDTKIYKEVSD